MTQFVGGRYQLIAQLGGGGMADVYLAKLTGKADFAKLAVVKRLKALEDEDPEIVKMFADEARLCARLNHPNIVQTFEVGEDTTGPFLVMEYIEGQPLGRLRSRANRREKQIPRNVALKILCDTIDALAYAHTLADHDGTPLRVVHRDVSPENIMVTYTGNTKLVDFGVAKTTASASVTRAGVLKGKVAYMAPEQARSDTNIDGRADVFAAGLILWELLTHKRLWEGMSEAGVFERLLDKDPLPRTRSIDETIPEDLDAICAKAMEKEKEDRYANASDLLDALEKACAKNDLRASDREVGAFVAGLFETEREKVKALVSGSVAKPKSDEASGTSPVPQAGNPSLDPSVPPREESDPLMWRSLSSGSLSSPSLMAEGSSMPAETPAGVAETRPPEPPPHPRESHGRKLAGGVAVLLLVGVAAFIGIRVGATSQTTEHPNVPATAAQPSSSPPPTAEVPAEITVDITVKPASAKISIDGKPVPNPHHLKIARADANHEIRAEAEGYETRSMMVAFDRDRALDMVLSKSTAQAVLTAPAPPPPPPLRTTQPVTPPTPHGATAHPTNTGATTAAPSSNRGISELDPTKPKSGKQDKIDTDVFKR